MRIRPALRAGVALLVAAAGLGPAPDAVAIERLHYQTYPHLEGKIVNQVLVLGNNRTQDLVFTREMRLAPGVVFRSRDLWADWERIVDLGIFAHVEVEAVPSADGVLIVVSVFERPRWFVAPTAEYDFNDKQLTVGYRVRARNLEGMNRQFRSRGRIGARDTFSVTWSTPWIGERKQTLSLSATIELPTREPDALRTSTISVSTTRFFGDYKRVRRAVTAFAALEVLERDGTSPEGRVNQLSPVVGLGFFRDTRNVRIDPARGTFFLVGSHIASGWTTDEISYLRTSVDTRAFFSMGRGFVLAGRVGTVATTGEIPEYRKLGLGGGGSIRGQPTDIVRGNNLGRASFELRFPLMAERRFGIPLPFVPRKISNFDLRIDGEIFVDSGAAWDDSVGFRSTRIRHGAGFGLRVFLPILELARVEIAFDESGSPTLYFREGNII